MGERFGAAVSGQPTQRMLEPPTVLPCPSSQFQQRGRFSWLEIIRAASFLSLDPLSTGVRP